MNSEYLKLTDDNIVWLDEVEYSYAANPNNAVGGFKEKAFNSYLTRFSEAVIKTQNFQAMRRKLAVLYEVGFNPDYLFNLQPTVYNNTTVYRFPSLSKMNTEQDIDNYYNRWNN